LAREHLRLTQRLQEWRPASTSVVAAGSMAPGYRCRDGGRLHMTSTTLTRPELTAADRCDRCGAAAKVRAILPTGGELLIGRSEEHTSELQSLAYLVCRL